MMLLRIAGSLFVTGLVLGAGPCLLSCGPLLVSYVAAAHQDARQGLRTYLIFSATRLFVYFLFGCLVGLIGEHVMRRILESPFLGYIFVGCGAWVAAVGVLLAVRMSAHGNRCHDFMHRHMISHDVKSVVLFGLVVSLAPCLPLLAVLGYIALIADSWVKGVVFMTAFGLGTTLSPVLFFILGAGWFAGWLKNKEAWSRRIQFVAGVILAYLGAGLFISGLAALRGA
jgi:sulfite exporter TauE/SafE